ncbi:hypothetical protein AB0H36_47565 [Kribbella sp. NPDC050820]|uniref:hypothetical protein n=1 Tax=Kribbella sp. NPDC050820 TaxID=3155408 RepID=UPI0033EA0803
MSDHEIMLITAAAGGGTMFGSQALETAIGLALMFFVIATAASMITETIAQVFSTRAKNLKSTIGALLAGVAADETHLSEAVESFKGTAVYDAAKAGAGRRLGRVRRDPSYLSAKAFADGALELLKRDGRLVDLEHWPAGLRKLLEPIVTEVGADLVSIKASLERTFDEAMERTQGAYKRWATAVLFVIGLIIAVAGNVSTIDVASNLWRDSVTRQAVVDAAGQVAADGSTQTEITNVAQATDELEQLGLPLGWTQAAQNEWTNGFGLAEVTAVGGWLLTAVLVMMGAPFWFDLLTKLVTLRSSGAKPPTAPADPLSATSAVEARQQTSALKTELEQPSRGLAVLRAFAPQKKTDRGQQIDAAPSVEDYLARALRVPRA